MSGGIVDDVHVDKMAESFVKEQRPIAITASLHHLYQKTGTLLSLDLGLRTVHCHMRILRIFSTSVRKQLQF